MNGFKRNGVVLIATLALLLGLGFVWHTLGPRNLFGAFLLNLLPTSWAPSVRSALTLSLPAGYYRLRPFEKQGRLYARLGVRRFQKLLRMPVLAVSNRDIPQSFHQKDLARLEREMRFAETSHVLAASLVSLFILVALRRGWWDAVASLTFWNLCVNLYPIMLQRFNRGRLLPLTSKVARVIQQAREERNRKG